MLINSADETKQGITYYTYFMIGLCGVNVLITTFFFTKAPTETIKKPKTSARSSLLKAFKIMFASPDCRAILIIFSLTKGSFICINTIMIILMSTLHYTKLHGSVIVLASLVGGLILSILYTKKFGKVKRQRDNLSILATISLLLLASSVIFLYFGWGIPFMLSITLSGAMIYPLIPMMLEIVARLNKKISIPLSVVNAMMMLMAQLFGFILQTIAGYFLKVENGCFMVLTFVMVVYSLVILCLQSQKTL